MAMYLNEDQEMLKDSASNFMKDKAPVSHMRHLRDVECPDGFKHALWKEFAEMGFTGLMIPEEEDGLGLGHVEAGVILEEIGRNLTPSPFLYTSIAGVTALKSAGEALRGQIFPKILSGDAILAMALDEGSKHAPFHIATKAERSGNGFTLSGKKTAVIHGASADTLIVAGRTAGGVDEQDGITLFAVDAKAAGVSAGAVRLLDSSVAAHIDLDNVEVNADAVIGEVDQGADILKAIYNAGRTGAAAEMLGVGNGAMDMTIGYLKERKQFGATIGSFQALQHRAAHLYAEMEIARAAVLKAQQLLDEGDAKAPFAVHVAKAKTGSATNLAVREGVQLHGGIGMTDEYDIGFYMKRDRALNEFMGDSNFHANALAEMFGY